MAHKTLVFLDGGALLNILASGCVTSVCTQSRFRFAVTDDVLSHPVTLWMPAEDQKDWQQSSQQPIPEPQLVDITELLASDVFEVYNVDDCLEMFVNLAMHLSDAQAKTTALALVHGGHVATDDRKLRRVVHALELGIPLHSTPELIREWHMSSQCSSEAVRLAVQSIALRAQFYPLDDDSLAEWWRGLV